MSELPHQNVGGGNPKVPIPRLYVPPPGAPATHSTHTHYPSSEPQTPGLRTKASRVAHACERCKARKIKVIYIGGFRGYFLVGILGLLYIN